MVGIEKGIFRKTSEVVPLWRNMFNLNLPTPGTE